MKISQMGTLRYTLCVTLIAAFISSGFCCTEDEFQCKSGECISLDLLCDGQPNCPDESDETAESCIQQSCPAFAYRCTYGACVSGSAECNGIKECADGSDEATVLCDSDKAASTKCSDEQVQCDTGECIDQEKACDGNSDCPDQSDETVERCASNYCPPYGFRCGYGACIVGDRKCDGVPDCRDGSDESSTLCPSQPKPVPPTPKPTPTRPGSRPTPTPRPTAAPPPLAGCIAPVIPNSLMVYENDDTQVVRGGNNVPDGISISYKCEKGYSRVGIQFNLCFQSKWRNEVEPQCLKFCKPLDGVTFRTECELNGASVPCGDRIVPGTIARMFCRAKYRKPDDRNSLQNSLRCDTDGNWDYSPYRCVPICGEELTRVEPFIVNGVPTNITEVPWHVGIFHNFDLSGNYQHHCGGTIINAKVVISAAHCFWDPANQKLYDKSLFIVGAGKYYRDYNAKEINAQYQNISQIAKSDLFTADAYTYQGDIAVVVLTNHLIFSPYIAPVCIDWKEKGDQWILSKTFGRVAGWGIDETDKPSVVLRSTDMEATSYGDCKNEAGEYRSAITNDKFCVINRHSDVVCQGDSGGGFTVKEVVGGKNIYYLWGIVSGGVPSGRKCREFDFVSYTNIQFFRPLIEVMETNNRVK